MTGWGWSQKEKGVYRCCSDSECEIALVKLELKEQKKREKSSSFLKY